MMFNKANMEEEISYNEKASYDRFGKSKLVIQILVFAFVILTTSITVSAHSGRTDANGGHYDRKTGIYHYHNGSGGTNDKTENVDIVVPSSLKIKNIPLHLVQILCL